ncbi:hypothetical protein F2Q69_00046275 [Brassica cretica]|uniref:Uncharacterized protein n=1 Tax=Brassica cretica TaxID=69181 RepID=A0A8S9PSF0_BRACR|nr:hypothetical protein F2Q69_00046275 [Brassica cretica]
MSPILDRIVRTDCGARQCTDQGWTSDPVAGRGPGQAQSAQESVVSAHSVLFSSRELMDLAHSDGDSWQSPHLSLAECSGPDQCGRVRAVTEPSRWSVWDEETMCDLG